MFIFFFFKIYLQPHFFSSFFPCIPKNNIYIYSYEKKTLCVAHSKPHVKNSSFSLFHVWRDGIGIDIRVDYLFSWLTSMLPFFSSCKTVDNDVTNTKRNLSGMVEDQTVENGSSCMMRVVDVRRNGGNPLSGEFI